MKRSLIVFGLVMTAAVLVVAGILIGYLNRPTNNKTAPATTPSTPTPSSRAGNPLVRPPVFPDALPADDPPGPPVPMRQSNYCTKVNVLPDTDFRVPPKYFGMLNLPEAWRYGRGGGVKVAVIDTGVAPHPRLPHLVGGGDYVMGGDGLSDCDARGTIVASLIGAAPAATDAFTGVAPDVDLISIRQSSQEFFPTDPDSGHPEAQRTLRIHTLARAVLHAANMGASVINISDVMCMSPGNALEQRDLGAALQYAAVDKNAVIVAAAGDLSMEDCLQNPIDPVRANTPRDWRGLRTVVTPGWLSDHVLTVGTVDSAGAPPANKSMAGPWVSIAAPGTDIVGLSPRSDGLINAIDGPNDELLVPTGSSFSTAIVSGVAALVRAKYPQLSPREVIDRLVRAARAPAGGPDDLIGYGIVDPVAALQ